MTVDWAHLLIEQLKFDWDAHLWPRLQGLSDDEYLWEPVPGCASIRKGPDGVWVVDSDEPAPGDPPPVTTIAWRIDHLVDNMGRRANWFFDAGVSFEPKGDAEGALAQLELAYRTWMSVVQALDDEAIQRPLGPKGGPYADDSMAALILHVSRETIHHGAEICLLRDLYRAGPR
jgi:DinB superfamily